jgi:hypothetical protein
MRRRHNPLANTRALGPQANCADGASGFRHGRHGYGFAALIAPLLEIPIIVITLPIGTKFETANYQFRAATMFAPGEPPRQVATTARGQSRISLEDYAVAMINEFDNPAHSRQRFTVGY